jgi:hypothetical protein
VVVSVRREGEEEGCCACGGGAECTAGRREKVEGSEDRRRTLQLVAAVVGVNGGMTEERKFRLRRMPIKVGE